MTDAELSKSHPPTTPLGWVVRVGVYTCLLVSLGSTFFLDTRLWEAAKVGDLPVWAPLLPVVTFSAFVLIYMVDRALLVRRRGYSFSRAVVQSAAALLFLSLLWPHQASEFRETKKRGPSSAPERLLRYRDAAVRQMACELAGFKGQVDLRDRVAELATGDADPSVQKACKAALERMPP